MKRLDDALRDALRREDPGPDFTARVLARAAAQPQHRPAWWRTLFSTFRPVRARWAMAGAMACFLVVAGAVFEYREQQERIEGQAAKQKLVLALRIAGTKLNMAREKVQELNAAGNRGE